MTIKKASHKNPVIQKTKFFQEYFDGRSPERILPTTHPQSSYYCGRFLLISQARKWQGLCLGFTELGICGVIKSRFLILDLGIF